MVMLRPTCIGPAINHRFLFTVIPGELTVAPETGNRRFGEDGINEVFIL
jgi:hypothetical protein